MDDMGEEKFAPSAVTISPLWDMQPNAYTDRLSTQVTNIPHERIRGIEIKEFEETAVFRAGRGGGACIRCLP